MVHKPKPAPLTALAAPRNQAAQPSVTFSADNARVTAELPTGEAVEVLLHGATVLRWRDGAGRERLWLSEAAAVDGSRAVRGGVPVVFPVFGTAPDHPQAGRLPQHGFARTSRWEFLGKSTSESAADLSVKLDFGLSSAAEGLDPTAAPLWPFRFNLIYSVTLSRESLTTSIVVTNDDDKAFDCQVLMHTYLRVGDIAAVEITGLDGASYVDKVDGAKTKTESSAPLTITGETDRVYTPAGDGSSPVSVVENGKTTFSVTRENLGNVVVWNPWAEKAAGMADFAPRDGFKNMVCIEPGAVGGWQSVEPGDAFEGAQTITLPQ
ncbi:galactose mutarotase-like protein [Trichocladium antarcticum]|uniref:Glucose-6-phosphate 1-epimerase n=1 Tax=Trichocladium antarcticum TaxID=1450529 RepID=A0AAN6ZFP6_9PEZI|nr:galactose mutarotase-like protein [Trichocladium antarcticum]